MKATIFFVAPYGLWAQIVEPNKVTKILLHCLDMPKDLEYWNMSIGQEINVEIIHIVDNNNIIDPEPGVIYAAGRII